MSNLTIVILPIAEASMSGVRYILRLRQQGRLKKINECYKFCVIAKGVCLEHSISESEHTGQVTVHGPDLLGRFRAVFRLRKARYDAECIDIGIKVHEELYGTDVARLHSSEERRSSRIVRCLGGNDTRFDK